MHPWRRVRLSGTQRLDLAHMVSVGVAVSACLVMLSVVRPPLAARSVSEVSLVAALAEPREAAVVPFVNDAQPAPRVRRLIHPAVRLASTRMATLAGPLEPQAPRPAATDRPQRALARFFVGDGKYRVQPFPRVAAPE